MPNCVIDRVRILEKRVRSGVRMAAARLIARFRLSGGCPVDSIGNDNQQQQRGHHKGRNQPVLEPVALKGGGNHRRARSLIVGHVPI